MKHLDDEAVRKWMDDASADILPKVEDSAFVMAIIPEPDNVDPFLVFQVGAAVLLEKPLLLISLKGAWIPARARQLAAEVVEVEDIHGPEDRKKVQAALLRIVERLRNAEVKV